MGAPGDLVLGRLFETESPFPVGHRGHGEQQSVPAVRLAAQRMYRDFPNDLRPSQTAKALSYFGTIVEFSFPLLLAGGSGGWATRLGLAMMLLFHFFITSNVPMGVPIEWNVFMVYGGFFLFGAQSHVSLFDLHSPLLVAYLLVALVLAPLLGNLFPAWVSFLVSMRYYAGNWPYSVWLFRGDSAKARSPPRQVFRPGSRSTQTALR